MCNNCNHDHNGVDMYDSFSSDVAANPNNCNQEELMSKLGFKLQDSLTTQKDHYMKFPSHEWLSVETVGYIMQLIRYYGVECRFDEVNKIPDNPYLYENGKLIYVKNRLKQLQDSLGKK